MSGSLPGSARGLAAGGGPPSRIAEDISVLNATEFLIRRAISRVDASPFLAHCYIRKENVEKGHCSFRKFINGRSGLFTEVFRRWPLTSVWNFAIALSEDYGEDGHAVYPVLERVFGVSIVGTVRNDISRSFRSVCRKYGLCFDGSDRLVNDYLAQAGIANSQLHHVAKAFLSAERAFGSPNVDSTAALNRWEDDALHFLPPGINIPRMVLEVDQSAYYAFLFARFRQRESARNEFEKLFFEEITKASNSTSGGQRVQAAPRPSLIWNQDGLALSLPRLEGRLSVSIGSDTRKLRGGQHWQLPIPWPSHIDWGLADHSERLSIFPSAQCMLVFDQEFGKLVGKIDSASSREQSVDAREIVVAAASPFSVNGEPAYRVGLEGYAIQCPLAPNGAILRIGSQDVKITSKPRPRIWIETGIVAKGPKGPLLSEGSSFGIEMGDLNGEDCELAFSVDGGDEFIVPITMSLEALYATVELPAYASITDLASVRAELRQRNSKRALVRYKAWLWPGLRGLRDGIIFDSDTVPSNYSADYSRHAVTTQAGQICLESDTAYESAILTFMVGSERVDFEIPRPGISLSYTDVDGRSLPLKVGETLIVRQEDKAGSLSVRCPDRNATLTVRGRLEAQAFKRTATRVLSLADLMAPAPRDDVIIEAPQFASVPIVLARIVPAAAPTSFSLTRRGEALILKIEMPTTVDAVRFSLEDETGLRHEYDCALTHLPVPNGTPIWLNANLDFENIDRFLVSIDLRHFTSDLFLATISVRPSGTDSFRPLRNLRGDIYAIVLARTSAARFDEPVDPASLHERFPTLSAWMCQCFAQECWDHSGNVLMNRWMSAGNALTDSSQGLGLLLSCAHAPQQPGMARSWVPLAHPLQIVPSLYGAPPASFMRLAADVSEGSEHLALLAETAGRTIPEIHQAVEISPAFLMAFYNFAEAQVSNVPLHGFNFKKYKQLVGQLDTNPGERWFWRPGDQLLGPAHYGAALGRLIERLFEAGLGEEGSNEARIRTASTLAHAASRFNEKTLDTPQGIEISHDIFEFIPSLISGFARSSRQGRARDYFERMSSILGWSHREVVSHASFLIRLAPELLAFYLLLWELSSEREAS